MMATMTVVRYPKADGAEQALELLERLQGQQLIRIHDGAIVRWDPDNKKPHTQQLTSLTGAGALSGAFWGMLFGLIFFIPFFGAAVGATIGALSGHFARVGIDEGFINETKEQITPGTSALFLLTSDAVRDRIAEAAKGMEFEIIATNLSHEEEQKLREVFEVH
jgi:uncharacterized membrane protein